MDLPRNSVRADSPSPSDKSDVEDDVREAIGAIRKGEYRHALRLLEPACTSEAATAVEALRWSAEAHTQLGAHARAEKALRDAQALLPEVAAERRPTASAQVHLRLAACAQRKGEDAVAVALQEQAIAALDSEQMHHQPSLAAAWNNLGITRLRLGDDEAARNAFRKAVELRRTIHDAEGYCLAAANLASLCDDPGQVATEMRQSLTEARGLGARKQLLRTLEINLANSLEQAKQWRDAARARRELFELEMPEEELRMAAKCAACGASQPPVRCGRCKAVFFCGPACQRTAWPVHKHECQPKNEEAQRSKSQRECPICLEKVNLASVTESSPVYILACLHVVHCECWHSFSESRAEADTAVQCPLCRDSLPTQV